MVDLHAHSTFSLFDGGVSPKERVEIAKELGHTSVALSDHGCITGLVKLHKACKEYGMKSILGCEFYFQPKCKQERESYHINIFAKNLKGYENLCRLTNYAEEHKYYKGIIDFAGLEQFKEGLICTTACIGSYSSQAIIKGVDTQAIKYLSKLKDIFGEDLYIELQPYAVSEEGLQERLDEILIDIAKSCGYKTIITSDSHYGKKEDFDTYLKMHEIAKHTSIDIKKTYEERYIPTEEELIKRFCKMHYKRSFNSDKKAVMRYAKQCMKNLVEIEDKCENNILDGLQLSLPVFCKNGYKVLEEAVIAGLKKRKKYTKEYIKRCKEELAVIKHHGLEDYFLIVQDYVLFAKGKGIMVGAGRGSVCNCLVAYALHITDVDSLKFNLEFSRFLRMDKLKFPDIDLDFETARRGEVIDYIVTKYKGNSARIASYGKYAVDNLINDLAKVCELDYDKTTYEHEVKERKEIIRSIKNLCAIYVTEGEVNAKDLLATPEAKHFNREYCNIIKHFTKMYGKIRYLGGHACGVAVTGKPLLNYTGLRMTSGAIYTSYDLDDLDSINVLKFDMLGLKTMQEIGEMRRLSKTTDFDEAWLEDKALLEQFRLGNTTGIFQFVNRTAKRILGDIETDCFEDIIAGSSMNRPVPLALKVPEQYAYNKQNLDNVKNSKYYEYTKETYGTVIYQEQMMQICLHVGKMSWEQVDVMMKIIKHELNEKTRAQANEIKPFFVKGAVSNGMKKADASKLFEDMLGYLFNAGHATGYSLISLELMYYKVYYPTIYWYVKTKFANDDKEVAEFCERAVAEDVVVFLPHVNLSHESTTLRKEGNEFVIQQGLTNIKGVGDKAGSEILKERKANGIFKSYDDFYDRCKSRLVTSGVIKKLLECGALEFNKKKYIQRVVAYDTALCLRGMQRK